MLYYFFCCCCLVTSESESHSVVSNSAAPWTIESMEFSRLEYWSGQPFPSPGALPNPGIEPWCPTLQVDSLPAEPPGKPKNAGVRSLSLQWMFPTQESNQGLLYCWHIFYQLSYQGSPARLCLTLCNPIDCSLSGSSVHRISQVKILKWVAIPFCRGIFPTQGSNSRVLPWQTDSLPLGHLRSPYSLSLSCS